MKNRTAKKFLGVLPYILSFVAITALVVVGSLRNPSAVGDQPILSSLREANLSASASQHDESFIVASLADNFALPSAPSNTDNYYSVHFAYQLGQPANNPVLEKPNIIDTSNLNRDIIQYAVQQGDTLDAIAARFGVSTTDIRWSNNLRTNAVNPGSILYIPPGPGILYTVKAGDTFQSLADKYKSNAESIEIFNDLEKTGLVVGATIFLPGGSLPDQERPEYVRPTSRPPAGIVYPGVVGGGNTYARGWCTWYAAQWRLDNGNPIPNRWGNAKTWLAAARAAGYATGSTPRAGAIFHTYAGYYGHVGIVEAVHADGSITISDMNGISSWGRVGRETISAAEARQYNYIY